MQRIPFSREVAQSSFSISKGKSHHRFGFKGAEEMDLRAREEGREGEVAGRKEGSRERAGKNDQELTCFPSLVIQIHGR